MWPFADGTCAIGEYFEKLDDLKKGKEYMFISSEGCTFKTLAKRNKLTVAADNTFYNSYDIPLTNVLQIWRYVRGILPQDYEPYYFPDQANIKNLVDKAKHSISILENRILKFNP